MICGKTWGPGEWLRAISIWEACGRLGLDSVESLEYLTRKEREKPFRQKDDVMIAAGGVSC